MVAGHRRPTAQERADDAGTTAEEKFERFRGVCAVIDSAYRQALAHHRLELALEQLRTQSRV